MREYVGCRVERRGRNKLIMFQDDLINKIGKVFGEKVENMQEYGILAGSGEHIKRQDQEEPTSDRDEQTTYGRGVRLLLYLVKFSRTDISNAVRELSKVMMDDRRSITGYCTYLKRCLISWKSRGQNHVTLSSIEAKYVVVEVCTDIRFDKMVMEFLGLKMEMPITIHCDDV